MVFQKKTQRPQERKEPPAPPSRPKPKEPLLAMDTFIASRAPLPSITEEISPRPSKKKLFSDRGSLRKAFLLSEILKKIDER